MVTLPAANSLPRFQWIDKTGREQPLYGSQPDLREITDYVIDSNDWPSKRTTVHSVLTRTNFDLKCEVVSQSVLSRYIYLIIPDDLLMMNC